MAAFATSQLLCAFCLSLRRQREKPTVHAGGAKYRKARQGKTSFVVFAVKSSIKLLQGGGD
jgi:hypothetical protein